MATPPARLTYTVKETIAVLGLSRASVWRLIADGTLDSALLAGRRLVLADSIDLALRPPDIQVAPPEST